MPEMSKLNDDKFTKLKDSIEWSIRALETPRLNRLVAIEQYVTSNYSDGGSRKKVPTNFLELAVTIYARQLAPRVPNCMVSTKVKSLRPASLELESAVNQIPKEIDLVDTVRETVIEAMFSMGVVKVGLKESGEEIDGHDFGATFVDTVDFGDYFVDMHAKKYSAIQFEGNDYWMPTDEMKSSNMFDTTDIMVDEPTTLDTQGNQTAQSISVDNDEGEQYEGMTHLRDVWLPKTRTLLTYSVNDGIQRRLIYWDGPGKGPYLRLGFSDVPGNLLPLPPVALWMDLHLLGNSLFRKLAKQADSYKNVVAFPGGKDDVVRRLQRATDGDGMITPAGFKTESIKVGGIDQPTLAMFLQTRDLYSYFAGNLDSLGGLAPATETVGQDKLLAAAASARMKHMGDMTTRFMVSVFEVLAWYEWTDPIRERIVTRELVEAGIKLDTVWSAETREGDFLDYNFDIDVYSTQDDSPSAKLQRIGAIFTNYIVPSIPMIQAQGGSVDMKKMTGILAKLSDTPEIADIVTFDTDTPEDGQQPQGNPQPTRMPANTTRTNVRVSRSGGGTRSGKDNILSQVALGGNPQKSQTDQVPGL